MEQWKPVPNYEQFYEVSTLGRVKIVKTDNHILMKPSQPNGQKPRLKLSRNGKAETVTVADLVAKAFIPNPFGFERIDYKDGDKYNLHVDNLIWGIKTDKMVMLGFHKHNSMSLKKIRDGCNVHEMFDVLTGKGSVRKKKTWFYGKDMYGNVPKVKFENKLHVDMLDTIWEKWVKYEEDKRA